MNNNIMIDLETMGSGNNAAIVAIGAVRFGIDGIRETFYERVSLEESVSFGFDMDPGTVLWWLKQSDEARSEITNKSDCTFGAALSNLATFMGNDAIVWGNGSDFDNVILSNAYEGVFTKEWIPWKFWNNRCYRTVKNLYWDVEMERKGTHHNALDDARSQAKHLIKIAQVKGIDL